VNLDATNYLFKAIRDVKGETVFRDSMIPAHVAWNACENMKPVDMDEEAYAKAGNELREKERGSTNLIDS
jgi:hypothetical protein